jgi:uncharacterized membrane-anchored protein YhcB (DUF1043 family)
VNRWVVVGGGLIGLAWTFVSLVVGFALGAWFRSQETKWQLVDAQHDLADAHAALAEYREAVPKVFDRGVEAGKHLAEFQLVVAAVEQRHGDPHPERWLN